MAKPALKKPAIPAPKRTGHKTKLPRTHKNSVSDVLNADDQLAPKRIQRMLAFNKRQDAEKLKAKALGIISKPASANKSTPLTVDESLKLLSKQTALAARKKTKKHQKRQTYLNGRKAGPDEEKSRGELAEERLGKVTVKFGEVVNEPPRITVVPKNRSKQTILPSSIETPSTVDEVVAKKPAFADLEPQEKVGRTRKLKTLPEAERVALLKERDLAIEMYRKNKMKKQARTK